MRAFPSLPPRGAPRRMSGDGAGLRSGPRHRARAAGRRRPRRPRAGPRRPGRAARRAALRATGRRRRLRPRARGGAGGRLRQALSGARLGRASRRTPARTFRRSCARASCAPSAPPIEAGVPCVMTGHAFYRRLGRFRASLEPRTYRLLRSLGFDGRRDHRLARHRRQDAAPTGRPARCAPAPTCCCSPARRVRGAAIQQLLPLARRGELDAAAARVLRFRARYLAR